MPRGPLLVAACVALADAVAKAIVAERFLPGESRIVVPRVLYLTYVRNDRGAFGLGAALPWLYALLGLAGIALLVLLARAHLSRIPRRRRYQLALAYGAVVGGGMANVADRAFHGAVVDFIDFRVWPVFNLADVAVTLGLVAIAALGLARKESSPALSS